MFSKILLKLVDQAIVPALVLFATRVISLFVFARLLDAEFAMSKAGLVFESPSEYVAVNSYSMFAMIVVLMVALLNTLIKAYYFHNTHITPSLTAKLFTMKLSSFMQSSMDLYSEGVIWLSYAFLLTGVAGLMAYFGLIFSWVFYSSVVFSLMAFVLFVLDIEKELVETKRLKEDRSDYVLNLNMRD